MCVREAKTWREREKGKNTDRKNTERKTLLFLYPFLCCWTPK